MGALHGGVAAGRLAPGRDCDAERQSPADHGLPARLQRCERLPLLSDALEPVLREDVLRRQPRHLAADVPQCAALQLLHAPPLRLRLRGDGRRDGPAVLQRDERRLVRHEHVLGQRREGRADDDWRLLRLVDPAGEHGRQGGEPRPPHRGAARTARPRDLRHGRGRRHDVHAERVGCLRRRAGEGVQVHLRFRDGRKRVGQGGRPAGQVHLQPPACRRAGAHVDCLRHVGPRGRCGRLWPRQGRRRVHPRVHGLGRGERRLVPAAEVRRVRDDFGRDDQAEPGRRVRAVLRPGQDGRRQGRRGRGGLRPGRDERPDGRERPLRLPPDGGGRGGRDGARGEGRRLFHDGLGRCGRRRGRRGRGWRGRGR